MSTLIYSAITSLDGYVADTNGNFDWAQPDEEVHTFINDMEKPIGTYLYGRKMYETMAVWETMPLHDEPDCMRDFAHIWKAADKIVYSKTLKTVSGPKTQIKINFDAQEIKRLKQIESSDLAIGGPHIAAVAIKAGVVDEYHQFIAPVIIGAGNAWLPNNVHINLELVDEKRFPSGFIYLRYHLAR